MNPCRWGIDEAGKQPVLLIILNLLSLPYSVDRFDPAVIGKDEPAASITSLSVTIL